MSRSPKNKPEKYPPTEIYSEKAVWACTNLATGLKSRINGALAQVLKKYPHDYTLDLLSIGGAG